MKENKALVINIFWILLGAILIALSKLSQINDMYLGFGGGLVVVGVINLIRVFRYRSNSDYQEKVDIAINDERNNYIRLKAWSWAGYLFVLIAAAITIVCMILSYTLYMQIAAYTICLMVVLYWVSYLILSKKY